MSGTIRGRHDFHRDAIYFIGVCCLVLAAAGIARFGREPESAAQAFAAETGADPASAATNLPVGVSEDWLAEVARNLEKAEYDVSESAAGLQAPNRAHNLRTYFRDETIEIVPRDQAQPLWTWRWRTAAFGREEALRALPAGERIAGVERIEYRRSGLTEWYANSADGIE
ncbi:MAG: hypothetical protein PHQ19_01800 [Candidatus Krumholzibacteria bacterium]|nr:hypothetical protein [Candidatus Krumholzibacteria bacterium]